jgi:N-acetylglucosamine malate deacetylase 2
MAARVPVAIVAAHPDDEMIGLGALLPRFEHGLAIIHVTDGAPRSGCDARNAGCATWQEYAALRRCEFQRALAAAGASDAATLSLDCPDQQAAFRIADHGKRLAEMFQRLRPSMVFTHAYEGGHPDHDATAAAVHAAISLLNTPISMIEFAGYHAGANGFESECFFGDPVDVPRRPLTGPERQWKRELLNRYASQAAVLAQFPLQYEPMRLAPQYDFGRPPHSGTLYYERFDWGVKCVEWLALARRAFHHLDMPCMC